jgi:hypothetical protein
MAKKGRRGHNQGLMMRPFLCFDPTSTLLLSILSLAFLAENSNKLPLPMRYREKRGKT